MTSLTKMDGCNVNICYEMKTLVCFSYYHGGLVGHYMKAQES